MNWWFAAVDPNCRIAKIRAGFTVPNAELHDLDLIAIRTDKFSSEIAGEPARLQLQLRRNAWHGKEGALTNTTRIAHLRVPPDIVGMRRIQDRLFQRPHVEIIKTAKENVTPSLGTVVR